jgi:hypothetical protein
MALDVAKIEEKIDRVAAGAMTISDEIGGIKFEHMSEVMEFAKLMSIAGSAVPAHCRGEPGVCLAICIQALEWRMSPFAVANKSYVVENRGDKRIAYESQLIHAVIEARAPLIRTEHVWIIRDKDRSRIHSSILDWRRRTAGAGPEDVGVAILIQPCVGRLSQGTLTGPGMFSMCSNGFDEACGMGRRVRCARSGGPVLNEGTQTDCSDSQQDASMKNSPYDDLEDDRRDVLRWLFDATFGRIAATAQQIGAQIRLLGTLNRLLGK